MGRHVRLFATLVAVLAGLAMAAPGVWAGQPIRERIDVDMTSADPFLSTACGFAVMTHRRGHIVLREWPDRERGTVSVNSLNFALTAMANGNTYRFRDVGADQVRLTKDGPILSIIGQIPFGFNGVLKINLETDEVVHEPARDTSSRLVEVCAALSA